MNENKKDEDLTCRAGNRKSHRVGNDPCTLNEEMDNFFISVNQNNKIKYFTSENSSEFEAEHGVLSFFEQTFFETMDSFSIELTERQEQTIEQTERIQLKWSKELSHLCHLTKNLWNHTNWLVRMRYFFTLDPERMNESVTKKDKEIQNTLIDKINRSQGKQGYHGVARQMKYQDMWNLVRYSRHYKMLPAQTAQQVLIMLDKAWKGYFRAIKEWRKDPSKFLNEARPSIPGYKKKNGEFTAVFTNQQCKIKYGSLFFPFKMLLIPVLKNKDENFVWNKYQKKDVTELTEKELYILENIEYDNSKLYKDENGQRKRWHKSVNIRPQIKEFQQVRIVPKGSCYFLEVVYKKPIISLNLNHENVVGIDLGVNNLLTIVNNVGLRPIIIKGRVIKSINQFSNKQTARLRSELNKNDLMEDTIQMKRISQKRENRIYDYFHKASRYLIDYCIEHDIGRVIIGYNPTWKQKVNIGRRSNQNFVNIPFLKLVNQIHYKAEMVGNRVDLVEESYTSQTCCFCGTRRKSNRVHRGLYVCNKCGNVINADVNAGVNIIKKVESEMDYFQDPQLFQVLSRPITVTV